MNKHQQNTFSQLNFLFTDNYDVHFLIEPNQT